MDSNTWDSLCEKSREEHSEYVDRGLDDSCSTTPTLNSFNDDHEGVLSEIDHNRKAGKDKWFKLGAIEKCTSCEGHIAKIDFLEKKLAGSEKKKKKMEQRCNDLQRQCDDQQMQLNENQEKVKLLENGMCTSCEERKKQEITTLNEKIKELTKQCTSCEERKQEIITLKEKITEQDGEFFYKLNMAERRFEKELNACKEKSHHEKKEMKLKLNEEKMAHNVTKVDLEAKLNACKEKSHHEKKEMKLKLNEEKEAHKATKVDLEAKLTEACKEKSHEKEELIATMNVQLNEEKEAHNATKVDLEAKCKSLEENLHCERQERTTMVDRMNNLDKENNSQAEQILKAKKQEDSWKQTIAVLDEKVLGLMESNEELTHEKNYQLKSKQDLADKLNACKEKSHREKEEVIATMNAEVEQREKSIKSLGKKNANLQKINEDMASGIDELENQIEGKDDALNGLRVELNEVSTRASNLLIHNDSLQRIVNDLGASLQAFEGREQDVQDFRDQFRRIIDGLQHDQPDTDGLRLSEQPGQPDNPGHLQFRNGRVGIPALSLSDAVSDVSDVGNPALSLSDAVSVASDVDVPR